MALKVVLLMLFAAIVLSLIVLGAFWYFNKIDEREHEKELEELEQMNDWYDE